MPVLPPIAEIDLGEKRGRHLHDADAAPEDACGEAGKIAHDAAAESNDAIAPLDAELKQPLAQSCENGEALACLARPHHGLAEIKPVFGEACFERGEMKACDILIADDRAAGAGQARCDPLSGRPKQALADDDGIGAGGERNVDDGHAPCRCCRAAFHHFAFLRRLAGLGL